MAQRDPATVEELYALYAIPSDDLATVEEFYALYAIHLDALDGLLSAKGVREVSDRNFAALALTFQVGEALADLDDLGAGEE